MNKKMVLIRTSKEKSDYEQCHTMQEAFAHGVLMCKESRDAPHEMQLPLGGKDKITIPYAPHNAIQPGCANVFVAGVTAYQRRMAKACLELHRMARWWQSLLALY